MIKACVQFYVFHNNAEGNVIYSGAIYAILIQVYNRFAALRRAEPYGLILWNLRGHCIYYNTFIINKITYVFTYACVSVCARACIYMHLCVS